MAMTINCPKCTARFNIDESKLPADRVFLKCPKCAEKIEVNRPAAAAAAPEPGPMITADNEFSPPESQSPFDDAAAEELPPLAPPVAAAPVNPETEALNRQVLTLLSDLLKRGVRREAIDSEADGEDEKRALICDDEEMFVAILRDQLNAMGYRRIDVARTAAEALEKVKTGGYELVTVDQRYPDNPEGGYEVLRGLGSGGAAARRRTYAAFISADLKTIDTSSAFFHGANLTINKKDIKKAGALIHRGMIEYQRYYRVFNSVQDELTNLR
jgi:predicted Zn finger-like uncharacterized protein